MRLLPALLLAGGLFWPIHVRIPEPERDFSDLRFGDVTVHAVANTSAQPEMVVLWIDGGAGERVMPEAVPGRTIVHVDARTYLAREGAPKKKCIYPAAALEEIAQDAEKRLGREHYAHPIVAGDGIGGAIALQALESAPEGTFSGALSVGFVAEIPSGALLCTGDGPRGSLDPKRKRFIVAAPTDSLSAPWRAVQGAKDKDHSPASLAAFAAPAGTLARVITVEEGEKVVGAPKKAPWRERTLEALDAIALAALPVETPEPSAAESATATATTPAATPSPVVTAAPLASTEGIPLHRVEPAKDAKRDDRIQILITGDGGWAGIDKGVAAGFAGEGMRTIGFDALAYFWKKKSPEQLGASIARVIESIPPGTRIILSGFSFGADVLPFALNRVPAADRARVAGVVLIAPSKEASFEIHPLDWLVDTHHSGDKNTMPEFTLLDMPVVCLVPKDDKHSPCHDLPRFTIVDGKPGHHLGGDYRAVARSILVALDKLVPPLDAPPVPGESPMVSTSAGAAAGAATGSALGKEITGGP